MPLPLNKTNGLHSGMTLLFLALFAFPILPMKLSNGILMALALLTFISFFIKRIPIGKTLLWNLVFVLPFIPYLIELCIAGTQPTVRFEFEKKIFFFTAPLIIPMFIQITSFRNYQRALLVFALAVSILSLYAATVLCWQGILFNTSAYENGAYILRTQFEQISGLHPTYYALFALTSACFLLVKPASKNKWFYRGSIVLAVLLLSMVLMLAVRIAFAVGTLLLLVFIVRTKGTKLRKWMLSAGVLLAILLISVSVPSLRNRLSEMLSLDVGQINNTNTMSQRMTIAHCSIEVFTDHLWWGTGSGNAQQVLNDSYRAAGWQEGATQNFNAHNQYLSIGINYGIFMLFIFLACLFVICRKIVRVPEGIYFCLAILVFFLSESLLERQMGVYFFGLMGLLFYNRVD